MWHQANYVLMLKVVFRSNCCKGGTGLWTLGLEEDVKDSIRKDGLFVIQVVVGYGYGYILLLIIYNCCVL